MNLTETNIERAKNSRDTCPGCDGKGWQEGKDGIRIVCPMCNGSGQWKKYCYHLNYEDHTVIYPPTIYPAEWFRYDVV